MKCSHQNKHDGICDPAIYVFSLSKYIYAVGGEGKATTTVVYLCEKHSAGMVGLAKLGTPDGNRVIAEAVALKLNKS